MMTTINCDLKSFEDLAHSFAIRELTASREASDRYPFGPLFESVIAKAHEIGLMGATVPEECGGTGQGMSALCVILENICEVDASLGGIIFTNALSHEVLLSAGHKDTLNSILGQSNKARESMIACPAYSNPSEIHPSAEAVLINGDYMLSGTTEYMVLGNLSAHGLVPASIKGQDGLTFFLIELADEKLGMGEPVFSLGMHACPAVDITLNGIKGIRIGRENMGKEYFDQASDRMHAAVAAMQYGIMKGSFREALCYSQERFQGGWEIINWSGLRMILANMAVQVKVAEMVASGAAMAVEQKCPEWSILARSAALHLSELACKLTTDGIQVLGGNGYMKDYGQEKRFRDARQIQSLLGLAPVRKLGLIRAAMQG